MKKTTKTNTKNTTPTTTNPEEIMKEAEVKVEVTETTSPDTPVVEEVKEKRIYHTFKETIMLKIDKRGKNISAEQFYPIREKISAALDELQKLLDEMKKSSKSEKSINRKLSKFTKEQIEAYLKTLTVVE